ncbi:MAG: endonuclease III [Polyangiaceae bacterium]|nr:endonuclease III [Polyangiaceae bacterium]
MGPTPNKTRPATPEAAAPARSRAAAAAPARKPRKAAAAKAPAQGAIQAAKAVAASTFARLREVHPDAHCELDHGSAFQLLVATVLSAQTTDVLVNKVTPELFARYPAPPSLAAAQPAEVAELLRRRGMGMYNQKAKNIVGLAVGLMEKHGGEVPRTLADLVALPGVGRKTANVVLGVAFGAPEGVVVDTHVQRLSQRLGWTQSDKPEAIERDLCVLFPRSDWDMLSHTLIFHGRRICFARKPACAACAVNDVCPSAFHADDIGRKPPRPRPRKG